MSAITEQKCPHCGGAVEFNVGAQKLKCPYCDAEFDIAAMQQAEDFAANTVEQINWNSQGSQWGAGETDGMSVYACKSCGGEIVADATTGATSCPYCGNQVVMQGQFSGALKPDLVIPFKLDKKAAKEALKKHFKGKVFATTIPRNVRLGEAPSYGLPIHMYDKRSTGAEAYLSLSREVIARNRG